TYAKHMLIPILTDNRGFQPERLAQRAKDGKRFGFVRFINVFSVERLVNNLCTIWVGRLKLNANVARFNRENLKSRGIVDKIAKRFNKSSHNTFHKAVGNKDIGNSFVNVVKGSGMSLETESTPTIVLDDECLTTKDLSCSLIGRVKEFTSVSNLKKVLCNEGFDVLKISYLGHTFNRIASKWGKLMEIDDYDDTNFHSKRLCILTKVYQKILESFKIIFCGKVYWMRAKEVPGWTPEFTEEEAEDEVSVEDNHGGTRSDQEINNYNDESDVEEVPETCFNVPEGQKGNPEFKRVAFRWGLYNEQVAGDDNSFVHTVSDKENSGSVNKMSDSMGSCRLKKSGMPCTGGSILSFMEEVMKVGQTMRYNMDGRVNDITEIIKS
nr:nucleotide-binding alpha-beta plait domain-containing protein [Tanacetum cinerariifolium]